jgi:hypothetical protein
MESVRARRHAIRREAIQVGIGRCRGAGVGVEGSDEGVEGCQSVVSGGIDAGVRVRRVCQYPETACCHLAALTSCWDSSPSTRHRVTARQGLLYGHGGLPGLERRTQVSPRCECSHHTYGVSAPSPGSLA